MTFAAIDASRSLTAQANRLARAGVQRVGRYLSHTPEKNLTRNEALALGRAGIGCWMVWETTQGRALSGAQAGRDDAKDAAAQARSIGAPTGAGIYFAVDRDVTDAQVSGRIAEYFRAVRDELAGEYVPGAYGPGAVCASGLDNGLIRLAWVWAGIRTNGTEAFIASNRWHIRQHVEIKPNSAADTLRIGMEYDPDDFKDECGAFLLNDAGAVLLGGGVVVSGHGAGAAPGSGEQRGRFFVAARGGLRLRAGPGLEFGVITTVQTGTEVTVLGHDGPNGDWARVDLEDDGLVDGYMFAPLLVAADRANDEEIDEPGAS